MWTCEWCGESFTRRGTREYRFCSRSHADEWRARDTPSTEWLTQKYAVERLSLVDIGRMVERDPKTVHGWMRKAGIPTRSRGAESSPGSFRPGQSSAFKGHRHSDSTRELLRQKSKADGRVPYLRNGVHYLKGVTGADHPNWKGGLTPERISLYNSDEWKSTVRAVWMRDRTCQRCGISPPRHGPKHNRGHVHHIVSFKVAELRFVLDNLILLCAPCHRWIHSNANAQKELIG